MGLLEFLENNGFSIWMRESPSVFAYPTLLAFHTFGMGFLVGPSTAIALRVLGFARGLPIAPLVKFFRLINIAIGIAAVSGLLLLILDARSFLTMFAFYIKLLAIAGAIVSLRLLRRRILSDAENIETEGKMLARAILVCWAVAVTAGRVTAYDAFIGRQTTVAVVIFAIVMFVAGNAAFRVWGSKKPARQAPVSASND